MIITQSVYELHRGAFFGLPYRIIMMLTSLTMPLFTVTGFLLYLSRRKRKQAARALAGDVAAVAGGDMGGGDLLIVYASQTGTAEIARATRRRRWPMAGCGHRWCRSTG
ncbi:PepSY domain-containing protein [Sphingobium scionense]